MKRDSDFRFVAAVNGTLMAYRGGVVKGPNETRELIYSRIQSSFLMTKHANVQLEEH